MGKKTTCSAPKLSFVVHQTLKHILTKIWAYGKLTCTNISLKTKYNFPDKITTVLNPDFDRSEYYYRCNIACHE